MREISIAVLVFEKPLRFGRVHLTMPLDLRDGALGTRKRVDCGKEALLDRRGKHSRSFGANLATRMFSPPSNLSTDAFEVLCAGIVGAFLCGIWASAKRDGVDAGPRTAKVAGLTLLWFGLLAFVVSSGWLNEKPMPRVPLFFALVNGVSLGVGLSPIGGWLAQSISLGWLVQFQAFRFPLELILHSWVLQGSIPETMTWTGANWDIISGITALLLAPFATKSRAAAWVANIVGIVLLANVARVAVLSSPLPFGWHVSPPLVLAFHLPYAAILPVCVGGALLGHVVLTRALIARKD